MQMSAKSTATKNTWVDPDDAPELTDAWFENADLHQGKKLIRRGRPAGTTKASTTLRFDVDILEAFKATGKGWQRFFSIGSFHDRVVVVVWTVRGDARRIISMRYANEREINRYKKHLG